MLTTSVRNQTNFAYRRICYDGTIESIDFSNLEKARDRAAEAGSVFFAQNNRLADHGIYPALTMAGKEGSIIIAGPAAEAEKALDVIFGVPALERSTPKASENKFGLRAMMLNAFDAAVGAKAFMPSLTPSFVLAVNGHNDNVVRPVFAPEEMRLAA